MKAINLIAFVFVIMRKGRLRHSGYDFGFERTKILAEIPGLELPKSKSTKRMRTTNPIIRAIIAEVAFLKSTLGSEGRHLSTSDGKLAYVRIPKAASTAFCKSILQERFNTWQTDALTPKQINALADVCMEQSIAEKGKTKLFTVVRNPFARIVSVYREFFENTRGPFIYEDYLMGILRRNYSFRQFVDTIRVIPDGLKDQHFKPQHALLRYYDKSGQGVKVFRLEERDAVEKFVMARALKVEEVNRSAEYYDYTHYYDDETLEIVRKAYEVDIQRFGYGEAYHDLKFIIEQRPVQN